MCNPVPLRIARLLGLALALAWLPLSVPAEPAAAPAARADVPLPKDDPSGKFLEKHAAFLARGRAGPVGLLFLGDSITAAWATCPELWEKHFGAHQPANFGIAGDETQHVLWRLTHGELDGIAPKVVVLLIGTNNTGRHTAPEIAAGVREILRVIGGKLPQTKILLLGVLPRGDFRQKNGVIQEGAPRMAVIRELNPRLAALADGRRIHYRDFGELFTGPDGTASGSLMPDHLHLSAEGYRRWAEGLRPVLAELLH
jgi:beta-glucosidase